MSRQAAEQAAAGTQRPEEQKWMQVSGLKKYFPAAGSTISGGGQKVININVQKFFDSINFTTNNLRETATDLERTVLEVLSRVLVQGAASAV